MGRWQTLPFLKTTEATPSRERFNDAKSNYYRLQWECRVLLLKVFDICAHCHGAKLLQISKYILKCFAGYSWVSCDKPTDDDDRSSSDHVWHAAVFCQTIDVHSIHESTTETRLQNTNTDVLLTNTTTTGPVIVLYTVRRPPHLQVFIFGELYERLSDFQLIVIQEPHDLFAYDKNIHDFCLSVKLLFWIEQITWFIIMYDKSIK